MNNFMKSPCVHCPFRKDVRPFLTNARAKELAYNAINPYGTFPCHKTTEPNDDSDYGEMMIVETTKECAGHLSLQHNENGTCFYEDEGFKPSDLVYESAEEMIDAYELENN